MLCVEASGVLFKNRYMTYHLVYFIVSSYTDFQFTNIGHFCTYYMYSLLLNNDNYKCVIYTCSFDCDVFELKLKVLIVVARNNQLQNDAILPYLF